MVLSLKERLNGWGRVLATIGGVLIPLLATGLIAWGAVSSRLTAAEANIIELKATDARLLQAIETRVSRAELQEFMNQINQRLIDLRADLRVYYSRSARQSSSQ
jgi:hypothetical protein